MKGDAGDFFVFVTKLLPNVNPLRSLVQDPGLRLGNIVMRFFPKIRRGFPSQSPEKLIQLGIQA
ncbi:MAG: hypothetical protein RLZZ597_2138 [Cyanobacteriota bacterium]|jgi:hypothetical protein